MATELNIKNRALVLCGELRIAGLTEDSVNARLLNEIYPDCRRFVLEQHSWRFAREQLELAQLTTSPEGYDNAFELPGDLIKIVDFNNEDPEFRQQLSYEEVGEELHTNEDQAKITYVKDVTKAGLFSSGFVETLALYLAITIAFSRTKSQTLMDRLEARYDKTLAKAKRSDSGKGIRPRPADISFPNIAARSRSSTSFVRPLIINN